ncbi:hypothetical protein [Pseudomonas sp. GL93]|uniref:hypothetical protein n=1 Tax=Pseudomonas sp. GL93 TaxID=2014741 RepID=UPI001058866E|nr:hypothetical protein [Pseudomonas sp. GL93]
MKPSTRKKQPSFSLFCLTGFLSLAAIFGTTYASAESCPDLSQVKDSVINGAYTYQFGNWKGTNQPGAPDAEKSYLNAGLHFDRVTLAQRVISSTPGSEDPKETEKPGTTVAYIRCDYVGAGEDARIRLVKRVDQLPAPDAGTWENETTTNTAGTINKYCTHISCSFK